ncbi:hypothetical protein A2U01_0092013, partial [Trifolium medium]|nr:hypothetical protein [Trifolium medium]
MRGEVDVAVTVTDANRSDAFEISKNRVQLFLGYVGVKIAD